MLRVDLKELVTAQQMFDEILRANVPPETQNATIKVAIAAVRLGWNIRGAADLAKLETELSAMMGATAAEPYFKNLDRVLRSLDIK
jgi:hypothetical protein